ncbi:MAG TPA: hypothetical protein VN774_03980 [Candidatus Limnocylindrales bacterium]|nr:hypothetical protein [Candidatus Limnocylindrales bacterium]
MWLRDELLRLLPLLEVDFFDVEFFDVVVVVLGLVCGEVCADNPVVPRIHKPLASISPPAARKIVLVALGNFASIICSSNQSQY